MSQGSPHEPNEPKTSSSPFPAASTPASASPTCRSAAGPCIPCSPIPAAWMPKSAPSSSSAPPNSAPPAHVTVDGGPAIWDGFVKPFVWAGEGYQGQYPLLVSDRYLIVDAALARAQRARHASAIAHGCTGMGNDQVRFDLAVKALGDYEIVAPIREIQKEHTADPRLRAGVPRRARLRRARQAEGLHDQREPAGPDHVRRRDRPLGSAGRRRARLVRAAQRMAGASRCASTLDFDRTARRSRSTASRCAGAQLLAQAQHAVRAVRRRPRHVHRRHHHRPQGPHRVRSARPDRAAGRASRAGRSRADQAAEPLQARRRAQVGGTGVRRLLPRSAEDRPRSVPRVVAAHRQRRSRAGNARRPRRRGGHAIAAHPQRQGRDLRAVGRLGRGGGRRLHQAVRHEQHAVGRSQPRSPYARQNASLRNRQAP